MEIKWKQINDYPNYYVSNYGSIKNIKKNTLLTPYLNERGYLTIFLYNNGQRKRFAVHRVVAEAFLPNPNNLPQINHLDECKTNNNVNNLEWISQKDNLNYGTIQQRRLETLTANGSEKKP